MKEACGRECIGDIHMKGGLTGGAPKKRTGGAPKKRVPEAAGECAKSGKGVETPAKKAWLDICELVDNGAEDGWDLEDADELGK